MLDVGEIRGQEHSLDLESTILIGGSDFSTLADDKELLAVAYNLKTVVWVCLVDPLAKELRSRGSAAAKDHGAEQTKRDEAKDR